MAGGRDGTGQPGGTKSLDFLLTVKQRVAQANYPKRFEEGVHGAEGGERMRMDEK
jgi:hypothetical protein